MNYVLIALAAYLIGSVSMSIIVSKYLFHDDVRTHGSGNAGATNVARVFGWGPGILTFLCDFLKCFLSMEIGMRFGGEWGKCVAGVFCLIGHCFPVYFHFKGGKGVSTGACVALLIDWRLGAILISAFLVSVLITKIVSLSSLVAAVGCIIGVFILQVSLPMKVLGIFAALLVIFMHRENIGRLLRGEEKKFSAGKKREWKK